MFFLIKFLKLLDFDKLRNYNIVKTLREDTMLIKDSLDGRNIPDLMTALSGEKVTDVETFLARKEEIKKILQEKEYGFIPAPPEKMTVDAEEKFPNFAAGKAKRLELTFNVTVNGKTASFPVTSVVPKSEGTHPAFVFMNFSNDVPDKYLPSEELVDAGFAVFSFHHSSATTDNGDFTTGVAPLFVGEERKPTDPGKIAMWAWCAMRVMDYVQTLDNIDLKNVAVVGHSRLGKTALVAGAFDERFKYVISNDSGCSGAAVTRGKVGETVEVITNVFPYWFCPNYNNERDNFDNAGYDQHFLLALSAPRHVMIGSAKEDLWADPESEFLSAHLASEAWRLYGKAGLVSGDEIPEAKSVLADGDILYQVRFGTHYMSREDWREYISFINAKMAEDK